MAAQLNRTANVLIWITFTVPRSGAGCLTQHQRLDASGLLGAEGESRGAHVCRFVRCVIRKVQFASNARLGKNARDRPCSV